MGDYIGGGPEDQNIPYAVKIFIKPNLKSKLIPTQEGKIINMLEASYEEIKMAGEFDHPNIGKTFTCFDTEKDPEGKYYLMIELGDLGTIASAEEKEGVPASFTMNEKVIECVSKHVDNESYAPYCKSLKEKVAQFIFADVAQGIKYLHHPGVRVANRDIKPENIVFTSEKGSSAIGKRDRA